MIVNYSTTEKRYAIIENNKMTKIVIDQPVHHSFVGNIYLGIVTKVVSGLNAVFIDIGEEKQGFLHRDKLATFVNCTDEQKIKDQKNISAFVHQGERLLVQVEKDATGTKGPRLTGIIEFQGEQIIYMPNGGFVAASQKIEDQVLRDKLKVYGKSLVDQNEGLIFRTNSEKADQDEIQSELHLLRKEYEEIVKESSTYKGPKLVSMKDLFLTQLAEELNVIDYGEIWVDDLKLKQKLESILLQKKKNIEISLQLYSGKENIFSEMKLNLELEKALKRIVWLDNGSYLVIDETEALTVIDVNTGKFVGKSSRQTTVNIVNTEAAIEAVRQIILRDLGGMILIDFIDMKFERERQQIIQIVLNELKKDAKKAKIIGFTELGILQLTRRKTKPTLLETLFEKCPTCDGLGQVASPETVAFRLERELWEYRHSDYESVYVTTTEEVHRYFTDNNTIHKEKLEEAIGLNIFFTYVQAPKSFYEITKIV
ncbi:Rne/Rng family ribonuclease [Bacillus sp. CGMCC 1.16607]|uniref:Rne/Rng family ribonuclease n=1 Tax=Bacillus sp. CGMCC 1.16607 TaxID=3351842 RepID=UPI00363F6EA3